MLRELLRWIKVLHLIWHERHMTVEEELARCDADEAKFSRVRAALLQNIAELEALGARTPEETAKQRRWLYEKTQSFHEHTRSIREQCWLTEK